jgi:hypothetical protein
MQGLPGKVLPGLREMHLVQPMTGMEGKSPKKGFVRTGVRQRWLILSEETRTKGQKLEWV